MSLAKFRKVYHKNGSGRFVVSEGIAPSEYLFPHEGLPTLFTDIEDDRFEIVITQGTILSAVTHSSGDTRLVPANGTGSPVTWDDDELVGYGAATPSTDGPGVAVDSVQVPARSTPIGCAQYNLHRRFDKGTSQGAGWITRGYVEWPMVAGLNDDLAAGDLVAPDSIGRPVKISTGDAATYPWLVVGKVVAVEKFATNFDDGLLSYMVLPSDPGAVREVYSLTKNGPNKGSLGVRGNLDVENVVGAFRVTLNL